MDVTRPLEAFDEVLDDARRAGRIPNTADRLHAMRAALTAYEADKAIEKIKDEVRHG